MGAVFGSPVSFGTPSDHSPAAQLGNSEVPPGSTFPVNPAIIVVDATGRISSFNAEAELLYGWRADEVIGQLAAAILVSSQDLDMAGQIMANVMVGEPWEGFFSVLGKDCELVEVFARNTPLMWDGQVVAVVGTSIPKSKAPLHLVGNHPEPAVQFETEWKDDSLWLIGELDVVTAPQLEEAIFHVLQHHSLHLTLDVSQLRFCDCSGLGVLVKAQNELAKSGGKLILQSPSTQLMRILDITKLNTRMEFVLEDALVTLAE